MIVVRIRWVVKGRATNPNEVSGWVDSNDRLLASKASTLPTELHPARFTNSIQDQHHV